LSDDPKLRIALFTLVSVLEGELTHAEVCRTPEHMPRLVVAHAVMHALPDRFFRPNTTRLQGHYNKALALLVGETHLGSSELVQASYKLRWHRPVKGTHGRSEGSVELTTPPQVLVLLSDRLGAEYAASQFYKQALARTVYYESKDLW